MKKPKSKKYSQEMKIGLPTLSEAIRFRLEQYDHSQKQACLIMNISTTHFSELLNKKRMPSLSQVKALYHYGIPAKVLLR